MLRKLYSILLRPLSHIYGVGVALRNMLFDKGILQEQVYPVPIICVGNITVGGTGKTPHVEYILELLTPSYRVAVLSRGYKRKGYGLIEANVSHTAQDIGDEPMQLKLKYPQIRLIINGNRRESIAYLMNLPEEERPEVIVMDDGLQHRYVKPSCRIMLMDVARPIDEDCLLPEGRLREQASALYRMDCIVVTKCPENLKATERRGIERSLAPCPYQQVAFSSIAYLEPRKIIRLLSNNLQGVSEELTPKINSPILLLSGIARTSHLEAKITQEYKLVAHLSYPDHHNFNPRDIDLINQKYLELIQLYPSLCVFCTEKDAVRLIDYHDSFTSELLHRIYYLPIKTKFIHNKKGFEDLIFSVLKSKFIEK